MNYRSTAGAWNFFRFPCHATMAGVLACWLALLGGGHAHARSLNAQEGVNAPVLLAGQIAVLRDPSAQLGIEEIANAENRFTPLPKFLAAGYTRDVIWLRFTLSREAAAPARWLLEASPSHIDALTLYTPDGRGHFEATALGDQQPFSARPVAHHNPVFPLELPAGQATTYFLRMASANTMSMHLRLWQPPGFDAHQGSDDLHVGLMQGALIAIFFFNLCLWFWLRDKDHLSFACYILTFIPYTALRSGYAAQWFFPNSPALADHGLGLSLCLHLLTAVIFFSHTLRLRQHLPWLWRLSVVLGLFFAASVLLSAAGYYPTVALLVNAAAFPVSLVAIVGSTYLVARGHREYRLYALAVWLFVPVLLTTLMRILGLADLGDENDSRYQLGIVVHVVLLNIALAQRIRVAEKNYQQEKQRALETALQAERTLEDKVQQRANELSRANGALQHEVLQHAQLETQLRSALETQQKILAQRRQFVSMVSHEFRNPLAVIDFTVKWLEASNVGTEPAVQLRTQRIHKAMRRLSVLMENYLAEDRLSENVPAMQFDVSQLHALVQEVCALHHDLSPGRLTLTHLDPDVSLLCDRALLGTALHNLVQNALNYSPADTPIHVVARVRDGMAEIEVTDHGPGIEAAWQARLFERYYRAASSHQVHGTGLGLYLSRRIAKKHGGQVHLITTGPQGSRFRLTVPVHAAP